MSTWPGFPVGRCPISLRTSASVLSVITPGMVSGRGRRRDQSGRLRGAMSRLQQIGELGGVRGDASRLVVGQGLGRCWVIEIGKRGLLTFPGTADPNLS